MDSRPRSSARSRSRVTPGGSRRSPRSHGPGTSHPAHLPDADHGIAGADLGVAQCAQCHDSSTGSQQIVEVQATAEHRPFDDAQLAHMMSLAKKGIESLVARSPFVPSSTEALHRPRNADRSVWSLVAQLEA